MDASRELTNLDDIDNFQRIAHIQVPSAASLQWALTDGTILGVWEPVSLAVKIGLSYLFGPSPSTFARFNGLLHVLNILGSVKVSLMLFELLGVSHRFRSPVATVCAAAAAVGVCARGALACVCARL
jgi:hypothetical protein